MVYISKNGNSIEVNNNGIINNYTIVSIEQIDNNSIHLLCVEDVVCLLVNDTTINGNLINSIESMINSLS